MSDCQNTCPRCQLEMQPANFGSPRKCAFEGEAFGDNWNCGWVNVIRSAMYNNDDEPWALRVRNDFGIGSVGALVVDIPDPNDWAGSSLLAGLLVATWYKDRGGTDELRWAVAVTMDEGDLTTEQAALIVKALEAEAQP